MAGEIGDAIERADRESFIQEPPRTLKGRIGFLIRQLGKSGGGGDRCHRRLGQPLPARRP
ncbi:hypothetical protein FBY34_8604 [Streptomyces sp. SLBN-115]|nr:hypothetical protein FBY34_8604 [Streptomyces sp. SLBN-115]